MASKQPEPIALIGSGCRFPGGASSPSKLWELVREPWDCSSEIPKDRFSWEGVYSQEPRHGTTQTKRSYFIQQDLRRFDAQFFNITPAEADAVDPQQRLLLETVYEGLETAGLRMEDLQGTSTAVFVGIMGCDYADVVQRDADCVPTYIGTGTARSIHSNRISYFFDWNGPSMSIDTACSSSMMAIHLGVQALRNGESRVAIACGTSMILGPEYYIFLSNLNMLATDGRGKMWDASADGYARGEGVASIVMKKLSDAIADGDPIQCVIRETGVNQDGRTKGITVPSAQAQAALIRDTYRRAGLELTEAAGRPQYFEAHGTGTPVGDPNEAEAIDAAFFPADRVYGDDDVIQVGGIKTVIGHTEGTAGMAGLLKVVQALSHQQIPPNLLFQTMNPAVAPFAKHLSLATELKPWPKVPDNTPRRASVNSFGFGGSNGHAILESFDPKHYKVAIASQPGLDEQRSQIITTPFVFSAQSERVLRNVLQSYVEYLTNKDSVNLRDLAWSLQTRRSALTYKVACSADNVDSLLAQLEERLRHTCDKTKGQAVEVIGSKSSTKPGARILGIFTGQGAQWATMGADLYRSSAKFRDIFAGLDWSLAQLPPNDQPTWTLAEELLKDASTSRVNEAAISQPLCTAVQVALVDMLKSAHVKLGAVVGHSSGEIAAAHAAGFVSSFDAIRIAYYRGLYAKLAGGENGQKGAMLAVGTSVDDCQELCDDPDFKGRVKIAAINSPSSVTLSGDADAIGDLEVLFQEEKKFARSLKVEVAYHSHHMQPCAGPYLEALVACGIQVKQPRPEAPSWFSTVRNGKLMMKSEELSGLVVVVVLINVQEPRF